MPNDTVLSPEKLRLLNQLKPFISRNPQILRMNESQFENWKTKSPTTEGLSYQDIQLYKEHIPLERTIYQAPRPGISSEEPKITSLRQIKTSSQLTQWLSDYKQLLPKNIQQRIFLSRDDLAQKNVFYVKLWDQVRTLIPQEDFLRLEEATKSAKNEIEVSNAFIFWRNHLANRNLQLMLPDELAEAYRFWQIKHRSDEQKPLPEEKDVFYASPPSHSQPTASPITFSPKTPAPTFSQHTSDISSPPENTTISQEIIASPTEAELVTDQPPTPSTEISQSFPQPSKQISSQEVTPSQPLANRTASPQASEGDNRSDNRQQSSSHQSPQDIQRRINQAKERFEDIKNPRRIFDRTSQNIQNRTNGVRNMSQKATNGIKRLLKLGGKAGGIGEGGVAAAEGGAVAAGAGATLVETAPIWIPIVIVLLLLLFVLILLILLIYAIWFSPDEKFQRIIVQKTVDKTQVPNPADAKNPDDTKVTYTISATYDKKSQGITIVDIIPKNAVYASAEGQFTAYDASGQVVSDPNTHQDTVRKIAWTITNKDYKGTSGTSVPADFPAGWPTTGQITQGPRGGTDHADLYNRTKAESIDIAYLATTPEYATFDGIVDTADFSCGNCNGAGFSYGNHVILTNKDKTFQVYYGHLLPQALVTTGQTVKRGDVIGYMGSSGYSTGSHLHYEFRSLSLAPPYIPQAITPDNCDPGFSIPCQPTSITYEPVASTTTSSTDQNARGYWFQLHRSRAGKQPTEDLYHGVYGDALNSDHVMTSTVNPGIDGKSPTPRPDLLGKSYWVITKKEQNQGDAINLMGPDFLVLNIDYQNQYNGPLGYNECGPSRNEQCFWPTPGEFGLHGTGDTSSRLTDSGSSGCIRHSNDAITSIYNLLKNESGEIRYYISED